MTNFNSTMNSTSKQGGPSGITTGYITYYITVRMKEGKWERHYPVVQRFYSGAGAFLFGDVGYKHRYTIQQVSREEIGFNTWRDIKVRVQHQCKSQDEYNRITQFVSEQICPTLIN